MATKKAVRRQNAQVKNYTRQILPGYKKKLPPKAQELVEKTLLDHDLATAPLDDPRWTHLYEELHRLVNQAADAIDDTGGTHDDDNNANAPTQQHDSDVMEYQWASRSPSPNLAFQDPHPSDAAAPEPNNSSAPEMVRGDLKQAVHRQISSMLERQKGYIRTFDDVQAESWEPSSLVAMSILVEEMAKSQASFNAQRTMFAKDPRKQAKKKAKKEQEQA